MRIFSVSLLAGMLLLAGMSTAKADVFSVFADLPMASSIDFSEDSSAKADGVSGLKVGVTLPIFLGLAYEAYTIKLNQSRGDYAVQMVDVFLNLPLPVVNLAVGLGAGTGTPEGNGADAFKAGALTQYWASIGIPFAAIFDVHLGYHAFSGKNESKDKDLFADTDVKGTMTSLGIKVGF